MGICLFITILLISDTSLNLDACSCHLPYFLQHKSAEVSIVTNVFVPTLIWLEGFYDFNDPFCMLFFYPGLFALPNKGSLFAYNVETVLRNYFLTQASSWLFKLHFKQWLNAHFVPWSNDLIPAFWKTVAIYCNESADVNLKDRNLIQIYTLSP